MGRLLRFGQSRHAGASTYLTIAIEAGYFADHGVDLAVSQFPNTNAAISSVINGQTDVASGPGLPVVKAALDGADPLIVLSNASINVFVVMGAAGVASPDDLRGGRVAITEPYGQDALVMRRALADWGLDPDRDVTLVPLVGRRKSWEALLDGRVSAMTATVPEPAAARKLGLPILREFASDRRPYQLGGLVTTRRFADAEPELLRSFVAAATAGVRRFRAEPELALRHLRARVEFDDPDVLAETYRVFTSPHNHYVPDPRGLAEVARDFAESRGEPVDIDASAHVDPSFVPQP